MFEVNNGVAKIDGSKGKYNENNVSNPSVRYGRNSVQNFYSYLSQPMIYDNHAVPPILDFGLNPEAADNNIKKMEKYTEANEQYLNSLPPLEYEYRYMPNIHKSQDIDTDSLLGAAYEEMGCKRNISVDDMDKSIAPNENSSASSMDINKDGKIDIGEYGSSILAADMISNGGNIKGTINNQGHNAILELNKKSNAEAAEALYSSLYNQYNLKDATNNFKAD